MADGGYDAGYAATDCFWGIEAASLVRSFLETHVVSGKMVLDVGCGEGKNANAFAKAGASVIAIDCSELAVQNGKALFPSSDIEWHIGSVMDFVWADESFDVVVSYGLFHCIANGEAVQSLISRLQAATKPGGHNIFCTFNDRSHDLSAHPGFEPLLLRHEWYLEQYFRWSIITASDSDLHEMHPHNMIPHHHSLTRVLATKHG